MTLMKSNDVLGIELTGKGGGKLGTVRETFVDLASGHIGYLIVEGPSLLGGSGKYHPVPWSLVRYDPAAKVFQAEISKDEFKGSPSYDRTQLRSRDYAWDELSARYFNGAGSVEATV